MPGFAAFTPTFRVNRRPKNPMDKCTIVSVFPLPIVDYKPTATPNIHKIDAAPDNDFSITVVEGASWFKEMEEGQPFLEIPIPSTEVARALIQDYCIALPEYSPGVAAPGLFYCLGAFDKITIKKYVEPDVVDETGRLVSRGKPFDQLLAEARARQNEWFLRYVNMSDSDWARTNGNPLSISDMARIAARKLGLEDKPWLKNFKTAQMTPCFACGTLVNPTFPICPNCKTVINTERAKELKIQTANV